MIGPLAYRGDREAAAAFGISEDHFAEHVRPHVRHVQLGRVRLYPVTALQAFLEENATSPADELARRRRSA